MPVRSTARKKCKVVGEGLESLHVLGRMARVPHLQTVESRCDQRLEPFAAPTISGMRPDRETSSFMRHCNRILDGQLLFRDEGGSGAAKIAHKRVAEVGDDAARNQYACHVRSTNRAAVGLLQDFVDSYRYSENVQFSDDFFGAGVAVRAELTEPLL